MRIGIETQVYKREIRTPRDWGAARPAIVLLLVALTGLTSCHHASSNSNAITCTTSSSASSSTSTQTCTDPTTGISLTISPATISLNVRVIQVFNASLTGGTNPFVTWKVNGQVHGNDMVGIIDSSGNYTAPATTPSPNPVSVTATSVEDTNLTATAMVTITPAPVLTITSPAPPYPVQVTSGASSVNAKTFTASESGGQTGDMIYWCVAPVVNGKPQAAIDGGDPTYGMITATGANGENGVYTPPLTPPVGQEVMVTAALLQVGTQERDCLASAVSVPVMISGYSVSSLQGQFAFSLSGATTSASRFFRAGSFHADGAGKLGSVMETINGASGVTSGTFDGSFTVAPDGRGTLSFNDGLGPAPSNASNFDFVLVDGTHLQIIGFDATGTASGEATRQDLSTFSGDPLSALTGTYVFDFSGASGPNSISEIGEFTADGNGNITGGSIDISGEASNPFQIVANTSTYSVNSNGSGTLLLATSDPTFPTLNFAFYAMTRGSAKFVGTTQAVSGTTMEQQLLASGTSFDKTHLNGNYAFLLSGSGSGGNYASAGSFLADGNSGITSGVLDENLNGTPTQNSAFSGSYTVASNGRGTLMTSPGARTYVFYLGPTGTAVFQETDTIHPNITSDGLFNQQQGAVASSAVTSGGTGYAVNDTGTIAAGNQDATYIINSVTGNGAVLTFTITSGGTGYSVGAGNNTATGGLQPGTGTGFTVDILTTMFSLPSIRGNYAISSSGLSASSAETFLGQLRADGLGTISSGAIDLNTAGTLTSAVTIAGTYATSSSAVRGTLTLNLPGPLNQARTFAVYVASPTQAIVVGIDNGRLAAGQLLLRY